jgi:chemotaxis protein methyltransferase CheR
MRTLVENDPHFKRILEILLKNKKFDAHQYKVNYIKRRIAVRMRATGALTYPDYLKVLQTRPEESSLLFDRLTIHVTEFFRDSQIYQALGETILTQIARRASSNIIRIWCAGCSTGEEPYSLSILLRDWCALHPPYSFEILATDIDAVSIQTAAKAEYSLESIRRIPKDRIAQGFHVEGLKVKVLPEVRRFVRFQTQDLLKEWGGELSGFQMIFCRNLLIYLASVQQQKLYERFSRALVPGGYLVLGLTETLLGEARQLYNCADVRNRFYQAIETRDEWAWIKPRTTLILGPRFPFPRGLTTPSWNLKGRWNLTPMTVKSCSN